MAIKVQGNCNRMPDAGAEGERRCEYPKVRKKGMPDLKAKWHAAGK